MLRFGNSMIEKSEVVAIKREAEAITVYTRGGHEFVFENEVAERVWAYFDGSMPEADKVPRAHFR